MKVGYTGSSPTSTSPTVLKICRIIKLAKSRAVATDHVA
jgi:hypothetical protein